MDQKHPSAKLFQKVFLTKLFCYLWSTLVKKFIFFTMHHNVVQT